jgi:uncharacterized protein with NAD-binding domain and iron-sulfur cluster
MTPKMPEPTTSSLVEHWLLRAGALLGVLGATWAVTRGLIRPWFDELVLASWKRKKEEAERFMRNEMFQSELQQQVSDHLLIDKAIQVASANAHSISNLAGDVAKVALEQKAMATVLAGIPLIAASLENMNESLDRIGLSVERNTETQQHHGESIAALTAVLRADVPSRRHWTRRSTDPQIVDPEPVQEDVRD